MPKHAYIFQSIEGISDLIDHPLYASHSIKGPGVVGVLADTVDVTMASAVSIT